MSGSRNELASVGPTQLTAADGHALSVWRAEPSGPALGGIVVLQEIFGVNAHIREVCEGYGRRGFLAIAPALFDRAERDVELSYDAASVDIGRRLREAISWDDMMLDVAAAVTAASSAGPVAVIGYCWGGTLAFLAATRLPCVSCAVGYYGGQTQPFAHERMRVPMMMHFGEYDPRIPKDDIENIRRHNPGVEIHTFPADHGFNCNHRKEWHAPSAERAVALTLGFLALHMRAAV